MPSFSIGRFRLRHIGAVTLVAVTCSGSVFAADCVAPRERDAQTVRALQSRLMIAALSCNARNDYNRFVTTYQRHLAYHGTGLRKYFRKKHGRGHKRALNSFVTELANGASQASIKNRSRFCAESRTIFAALMSAPRHQAPLTLQAVALDTDWRPNRAKVCEALVQRNDRRR